MPPCGERRGRGPEVFTDMHKWTDIRRRILVNGETKRSVQRAYGIHWSTLNKVLSNTEPPGYRMAKKRPRPKLESFIDVIGSWLEADKAVNKKQRHRGKRVFDRRRKAPGDTGGYTVIKDYLRELKLKRQEVFMPLTHRPCEAQDDFGHADVFVDGKCGTSRFQSAGGLCGPHDAGATRAACSLGKFQSAWGLCGPHDGPAKGKGWGWAGFNPRGGFAAPTTRRQA